LQAHFSDQQFPSSATGNRKIVISVVIPHRDTPKALARCLAGFELQNVDFDYEIIVVDGSKVRPPGVELYPYAELIFDAAKGPGPARNAGAAASRGEIIAFIDADCLPAPGWLRSLRDAFSHNPEAGAVAGRVDVEPVEGRNWTPCGIFEATFAYQQARNVRRLGVAATANLAVRASAFAQVGEFSGVDFLEDFEWCQRAAQARVPLVYADEVRVRHEPRETFGALAAKWRRQVYQEHRSHRKSGKAASLFAWKAMKLAFLTPAVTGYLLTRREHSFADKLRAIPILWRIRAFRVTEMIRLLRQPDSPRPPWSAPEHE